MLFSAFSLFKFQIFVPLSTFLLFFSSFCAHSLCCQFCFRVLCYSVRREIYLAWLLLALLPLWRCGNVHLWQPLLRFCLFLFLPLHTSYTSIWSLLFSLESLQLGHFCLGIWAFGIQCFCTEGGCDKTVSPGAPSYNEVCGVRPLPVPAVLLIPHRAAHLPGTPWRTVTKEWGMTPAAPHLCCLSTKPWICSWHSHASSSLCVLGAFFSEWWLFNLPLVSCYHWVCCMLETERHGELTPRSSCIIHLALFLKSDYSIEGKCREEKSGTHRGYTEKVIFCVCLSCCFEKSLERVHLTYIWKPFTSIFSFPLGLATSQKKLSEISPCRWHLWVVGLKPVEASCSCQQTVSVPCDPPGDVADLWFGVVPLRRTNPAL